LIVQNAANVPTGPSPTEVSQPVSYNAGAAAASASAVVIQQLSAGDANLDAAKRDLIELQTIEKRGTCATQPDGYGPKPTSDTVDAFLNFQTFAVR